MSAESSSTAADAAEAADTGGLISRSPEDTQRLGERLGRAARRGDVIALWGELGTGKTVLARGVAAGLGVRAAEVTSPTFVILHEHHGGRLPLFHLDLYRLSGNDLDSTGWQEAVEGEGVTVIEWPDRAGDRLPSDRLDVRLAHASSGEGSERDTADRRRVVLEARGPRTRELLGELRRGAAGG